MRCHILGTILGCMALAPYTKGAPAQQFQREKTMVRLRPTEDTNRTILINTLRGADSNMDKADQVNKGNIWMCDGDPVRCDTQAADVTGVLYYGEDRVTDHRGMNTRWLGGPRLTLDNIWDHDLATDIDLMRPPTSTMRVMEGDSPILKSGINPRDKPMRVRWAFNRQAIYDHTNGLPDDGDDEHHTEFRVGRMFDIMLTEVRPEAAGRYSAVYQTHDTRPIMETDIELIVEYIPFPTIFVKDRKATRVTIHHHKEKVMLKCVASIGEPRALMTWHKDTHRVPKEVIEDRSNMHGQIQVLTVTKDDQGSMVTCSITSNLTTQTNSATVKVVPQRTGRRVKAHFEQSAKDKAEMDVGVMTVLVGATIVALAVGAAGAFVCARRCRNRKGMAEIPGTDPKPETD